MTDVDDVAVAVPTSHPQAGVDQVILRIDAALAPRCRGNVFRVSVATCEISSASAPVAAFVWPVKLTAAARVGADSPESPAGYRAMHHAFRQVIRRPYLPAMAPIPRLTASLWVAGSM